MKKLLLGTVAIAALAYGAANAAELPVYKAPPPVAPQWTWTGWYAGAAGGYSWGSATIHHGSDDVFFPGENFDISNPSIKGGIFGVEWGYNWQFGSWVVGYESDFSLTTQRGSEFDNPPFFTEDHHEVKEQWLSTWRGRLGWAAGNWLIYATGGAAVAHVELDDVSGPITITAANRAVGTCLNGDIGSTAFCAISENHYHWGWTAGGGVEWMVTPGVSVKAEYLFVDLQEKSYFNPAPVAGSSARNVFLSDQRLRLDNENIVRVGLNVHFDPFFPQSAVFGNR
jgi:outer membrane immunogenic protein